MSVALGAMGGVQGFRVPGFMRQGAGFGMWGFFCFGTEVLD